MGVRTAGLAPARPVMRASIRNVPFFEFERGVLILAKQAKSTMSRALVRRETISGYLFMLPSLIFFAGFVIIPMVICIFNSFTDANMHASEIHFVGLKNFVELWQDKTFLEALKNTFLIVVVSVPPCAPSPCGCLPPSTS